MAVVVRTYRTPPRKSAGTRHELPRRIVRHGVRFVVLTLALTGALALFGVPPLWAAIGSVILMDVLTLILLTRPTPTGDEPPAYSSEMRLTAINGWRDFLN